jgi:sialate O-acetylesterase
LDGWKEVTLPGDLGKQGLSDAGVIWLRRTVAITDSAANHYLVLSLGNLRDFDQVYWNGVRVGETTADNSTCTIASPRATNDRRYDVPGTQVRKGESVLAIRLFSPAGNAGVDGNPVFTGSVSWRAEPFVGGWMAKAEYELPALTDEARAAYPQRPLHPPADKEIPSHLFTSMIQPLSPYGLRGFIWYQGNANEGRAYQYRTAFKILIQDWREVWHDDTLPFYYCQLENSGLKKNIPGDDGAAELREAQSMALALPHTGQAVFIDIGEEANVHYKDKKDAGERLALIALAETYGQSISYSGPVYQSMSVEGSQIRVTFQHADGGLVAKPLPDTYQPNSTLPETKPLIKNSPASDLEGFAICGDDHKWVWADAKIDGDSVLVSSSQVTTPVAVRYAWSGNPTCNLYNGAGLPASPFRTDDFPAITLNNRYGK